MLTSFEYYVDHNLTVLTQIHGANLTQKMIEDFFILNPFIEKKEYNKILKLIIAQERLDEIKKGKKIA